MNNADIVIDQVLPVLTDLFPDNAEYGTPISDSEHIHLSINILRPDDTTKPIKLEYDMIQIKFKSDFIEDFLINEKNPIKRDRALARIKEHVRKRYSEFKAGAQLQNNVYNIEVTSQNLNLLHSV